jgi:hypothetical protein
MNKKIIIGGVVLIALGLGGYLIYKKNKNKPTKKMFDEMVANCKPPCDVFSGMTQSEFDKLFEGYKKLKMEDAQFMIDFLAKKESQITQSEGQRFQELIMGIYK